MILVRGMDGQVEGAPVKFWKRSGAEKPLDGGRFLSEGVSLAYEVAGAGPGVILVHGFASSIATNWRTPGVLRALTEAGFFTAAFDCRGHGHSDRPHTPGAYTLKAMAGDLERFIAFLRLPEPPHLVGYSMGARIVLQLLVTYPDIACSAVLGGVGEGVGESGAAFSAKIADALLIEDPRAITDTVARRFRLFAEHQGNDMTALAQCIREVTQPIDLSGLSALDMPVLVLAGEKDDQITAPEALARRFNKGRAEIIPGRNHMTVIGDARFRQVIAAFLKDGA